MVTTKYSILCCLFFVTLVAPVDGVAQPIDDREAKQHINYRNFFEAAKVYSRLTKAHPDDAEYWFMLGVCYINMDDKKAKAFKYFEKASTLKKPNKETYYYLGEAYTYVYEYDKALSAYETYLANNEGDKDVEKRIEDCKTAKKLMKNQLNVTFDNVGNRVNTPYKDYRPFVDGNGLAMVYTSRREENRGKKEVDGYYPADIWMSKIREGKWSKAKNAGGVNTVYDESTASLSEDGKTLYLYVDGLTYGDINQTSRRSISSSFTVSKPIPDARINTGDLESAGCMSPDGNTFFFSSKRAGGVGGLDIYYSKKLPNGEWGEAYLIPEINTSGDEDYPVLSHDGKVLYFSSNGHPGMGGMDLFKTNWNQERGTFTNPLNLGYPINSPYDNETISFTSNGRYAFVSDVRSGGFGDRDIYRITFNNVEQLSSLLMLKVYTGDETKPFSSEAMVSIEDTEGNLIGDYKANKAGHYPVILLPGEYVVRVELDGFKEKEEKIVLYELPPTEEVQEKLITLSK